MYTSSAIKKLLNISKVSVKNMSFEETKNGEIISCQSTTPRSGNISLSALRKEKP